MGKFGMPTVHEGRRVHASPEELTCAKMTILEEGFETRLGTCHIRPQREKPMSKHDTATKRHRRPKSAKRVDYTARTMAALKQLAHKAKVRESQSPLSKTS
jgi:hypothetical protein